MLNFRHLDNICQQQLFFLHFCDFYPFFQVGARGTRESFYNDFNSVSFCKVIQHTLKFKHTPNRFSRQDVFQNWSNSTKQGKCQPLLHRLVNSCWLFGSLMLSVFQCPWNFKNASKHVISNPGNSASHIMR